MDLDHFAARWIEDWNSRDIDRVVGHYAKDGEFRSLRAESLVGNGIVKGRDALRAYWGMALQKRPALKFHLKTAFVGYRAIAIHYGDELGRDVVETLLFDEHGQATTGCACPAS